MYEMKRRAVITGAASGLGRALSLEFAGRGWMVGLADIDKKGAQATLRLIRERSGSGAVFRCDVSSVQQVGEMADYFFSKWGGIDVLINNAGIGCSGPLGELPMEKWEKVVDVNLLGVVKGCHVFIPRMKEQGGGYIVNIASAAGLIPMTEMSAYCATKAAVVSLSEVLYSELAPHNIGVTVVCPSFFKTDIIKNMKANKMYCDEWSIDFGNTVLNQSRLSAEEIARMIYSAVERRDHCVIPHGSTRKMWRLKRLLPLYLTRILARLNKAGKLRDLMMKGAVRGRYN